MATVHYTVCGLEYIYLTGVKIRKMGGEDFVDLPPQDIFQAIVTAVIKNGIPLRGKEVQFLRKTLGLTKTDLANKLGITSAGISKWEGQPERRLSKINQAALRIVISEELGINHDIPVDWKFLAPEEDTPERLEVAA